MMWSVWWGTNWWIIDAADDAQARRAAFARLGRLARYHLPYLSSPAARDAQRAELLARLVVRPATDREVETYRVLVDATTAEGGASGRLAMLDPGR